MMFKTLCIQNWKQNLTLLAPQYPTQEQYVKLNPLLGQTLQLKPIKHSYTNRRSTPTQTKKKADIMWRHMPAISQRSTPPLLLLKSENYKVPEHT